MSVNQPGDVAYGFSQALLGVPSKPILAQRNPTTNDKAQIGTTWINQFLNKVFIITSIVDNVANWVETDSSGAFNEVITDSGNAVPIGGMLNLFGGPNINTSASGNTVDVNLNDIVNLPATNAGATQGIYQIGGVNFLFGYGPTNTFVGDSAGNTSLNPLLSVRNIGVGVNSSQGLTSGANNTALGAESLNVGASATNNVAVGYLSLTALTSGDSNIAVGTQSLQNLVTGLDNIAIGLAAGSALNGAQSSNIYIGNIGDSGDGNTIRIGTQGSSAGEQDSCYIAGIGGVTPGGTPQFVVVDPATGQMGSALHTGAIETIDGNSGTISGTTVTIEGGDNITTTGDNAQTMTVAVSGTTDHSLQLGNASGSLTSLGVALDGQLPIGSTGADPVLALLTAGTGINITNGAGSITIDSTVTPGIVTIDGDSGSATGATITFTAVAQAPTVAFNASGSTVTLDFQDGSNNIAIGTGSNAGTGDNIAIGQNVFENGAATAFQSISIGFNSSRGPCGTQNVAVGVGALEDTAFAGSYNLALGTVAGFAYNSTESSNIIIGSAGGTVGENNVIRIGDQGSGNLQQNTCYIAGIHGVTPGGGGIETVTIDSNGQLGSTSSSGGIVTLDGDTGSATGSTVTITGAQCGESVTFSGSGATITMHLTDASLRNTFLGLTAGNGAVSGNLNTSVGYGSLGNIGTGGHNTAIGYETMNGMATGSNNTAIGYGALAGDDGNKSTAIGDGALGAISAGFQNIALGYSAGSSYAGGEANNIIIGNSGVLGESTTIRLGDPAVQGACYIAGIGGVTPGGTPQIVIIDPVTGELGSTAGGGITAIDGDVGGGATSPTITFDATTNSGSTVSFNATDPHVYLRVSDGSDNTIIGFTAGNGSISGTANTGLGMATLHDLTLGNNNTAVGETCLDALTSGSNNVGIGQAALGNLTTGSGNICIGESAGLNYTTSEANNILLGNSGVVSESDVIRIGTFATQTECFVAGIAGVTVSNSAAVLINTTNGQLGTVASSRRYKENIQDIKGSGRILELQPVQFNYKNDTSRELHYGLIAEEVDGTIPEIVTYNKDKDPETVRYHELPVLLLNELQRQHAVIVELSRRLERLETRGTYESKA